MLNKVLHHVVMSWIIETNQQWKYDIEKHNPDWITYGTWYNTYICTKLYETAFENVLDMQALIDIILCVLLVHMRTSSHNL